MAKRTANGHESLVGGEPVSMNDRGLDVLREYMTDPTGQYTVIADTLRTSVNTVRDRILSMKEKGLVRPRVDLTVHGRRLVYGTDEITLGMVRTGDQNLPETGYGTRLFRTHGPYDTLAIMNSTAGDSDALADEMWPGAEREMHSVRPLREWDAKETEAPSHSESVRNRCRDILVHMLGKEDFDFSVRSIADEVRHPESTVRDALRRQGQMDAYLSRIASEPDFQAFGVQQYIVTAEPADDPLLVRAGLMSDQSVLTDMSFVDQDSGELFISTISPRGGYAHMGGMSEDRGATVKDVRPVFPTEMLRLTVESVHYRRRLMDALNPK